MGIATKPLSSLPDTEQSFSEMLDRHKRNIGYAVVGALVISGGGWFYMRSKALKTQRAEEAYLRAVQSAYSGNPRLAESDLKKVSVRYAGTPGGSLSAIALAKLYYDGGNYQAGIDALQRVAEKAGDMAFDVHMLRAAGFEGLKKDTEAAKAYEEAASKARFAADRDQARANAARAYGDAGNRDAAVKIWTELAKDPESPLADEAHVRLGELRAAAATS